MKKLVVLLGLLLIQSFAQADTPAQILAQEISHVGLARFTSSDYKPGLVRHIVMFQYRPEVTAAQKEDIKQSFLNLAHLCNRNGRSYVVKIETGADNSGEGAEHGLEQTFIVTFRSEGDRNFYVGAPIITDANFYDPNHQAFKNKVGPLLAIDGQGNVTGATVFDFTVGE